MKYNSKLRTAIKEIVCASYEHPTAEVVYLMMQNKNINTSISTVYRNLHQLSEEGIIKEIVMPSGKVHYDGRTYDHGHAYCISCNRIYDLSISDKEIDDLVAKEIGMKVLNHEITIKGICKECMNKVNQQK